MVISPNSYDNNINLRQGTLIRVPNIIRSFNLTNIDKNIVTVDALATKYPNIVYNKETGLFNGTYRDPRITVNFWEDLKEHYPNLYKSQLANLTSGPLPTNKNREEYKQFLKDHQLLINTMEYFYKNWESLFKPVLGIPNDHKDYRVLVEWAKNIKKSWDFVKDFLQDGGTKNMSDERLQEYHQEFIDSITIMSVSGSNNPFKMILNQELKDAKLDRIIFSSGKAWVKGLKFNELSVAYNGDSDIKGCICITDCELNTIDLISRCDVFAVKDSTINTMPRIIVQEATYLDNVKSNEPIDLDISSTEALLLNNTEVSENIYLTLKQMSDKSQHSYTGRNIKLYNFEDFKEKGVCSEDYHYHPDVNSPPILIEGTFVDAFRIVLDTDSMIKKLYRKLNTDVVYSFSIYTDDPKMLEFVYSITEGGKYKGIPANMFYLLKKLLNK